MAELVKEEKIRSASFDEFESVRKLWAEPGDPNLTVFRFVPLVYGYMKPGEWDSIRVSA